MHDGHLQPPDEQQGDLRRHQAGADDADLGDRAGQRLVRRARRARGPASARGRTRTGRRAAHRTAAGRPGPRPRRRTPRRGRRCAPPRPGPAPGTARARRRAACRRRRTARPATAASHSSAVPAGAASGASAPATGPPGHGRRASTPRRPAQRLLKEVGGLEHRVGDAELERLGAAQHLVLRQRVLDDQLQRAGGPDQPGQQVGAAPAGHQAEEALGEGDHRHAGGDRPVGAVQRDLEAAAERRRR